MAFYDSSKYITPTTTPTTAGTGTFSITNTSPSLKLRLRLIRKNEDNFKKVHTSSSSLNITHQFVIFCCKSPNTTISVLKDEIISLFTKFYPFSPSLNTNGVHIKLQDDAFFDLDDAFRVDDLFEDGSIINVIYYIPSKSSNSSILPSKTITNPLVSSSIKSLPNSSPIPSLMSQQALPIPVVTLPVEEIPPPITMDLKNFSIPIPQRKQEISFNEKQSESNSINLSEESTTDEDEDDWSDITPSSTPLPTPLTSLNEEMKSISPIPPSPTGTPLRFTGHKKLRIRKINKRKNRLTKILKNKEE